MEYEEQLDIRIVDTVFDPDVYGIEMNADNIVEKRPKVAFKRSGNSSLYKVWIFLDGSDLPRVDSITYHLHKTFVPPTRVVSRTPSNPTCRFVTWTWGIFQIRAAIVDKAGRNYSLVHKLTYGDTLEKYRSSIEFTPTSLESSDGAKLVA